MVERARRELPKAQFLHGNEALGLDEARPFDLVLMLAVLTCNPLDSDQASLMQRVEGLLRPGGLLFISDLWVQTDERNQQRYRDHASDPWGVF
jgi:trans-aconitate methyltransferase